MSELVHVRLDAAQADRLDKWPGRNRSEKLRSLLDSQTVAKTIALETATAVLHETAPLVAALARQDRLIQRLQQQVDKYTTAAATATKESREVTTAEMAQFSKILANTLREHRDDLMRAVDDRMERMRVEVASLKVPLTEIRGWTAPQRQAADPPRRGRWGH